MTDRIAVFSQGIMQQLAKPLDLHFQPATPFVATFVGETNCWTAVAASVSIDGVVATVRGVTAGPLPMPTGVNCAAGDRLSIYLRPEFIELAESTDNHPGFVGLVRSINFQGALADVIVECQSLGTITIRTARVLSALAVGDPISVVPEWARGVLYRAT